MAVARRSWCRVCGERALLPRWKALVGLDHARCADERACLARYRAKRERPSRVVEPAARPEPAAGELLAG